MEALTVARRYHDAWTSRRFNDAAAFLDDELTVEVPINEYPTAAAFAEAVEGFGSLARRVDLLSGLGDDREAMLLYDMDVEGLGALRVVEHFSVSGGRIRRLRQVHDTAPLRAAGFAGDAA